MPIFECTLYRKLFGYTKSIPVAQGITNRTVSAERAAERFQEVDG